MADYGYLLPTRGAVLETDTRTALADRLRRDVLDLAVEAESLGFDGVWVGDSVLAKPRPEPLTTLAAISGRTDDLTLGTAVYLPTLRHPVHVAHQIATLALLSGGRIALGMGVGRGPAVEAEYGNLDRPYHRRGRLLDEVLDAVDGLLAGESVTYDGEHFEVTDASIGLRPVEGVSTYVPYRTVGEGGTFPPHVRDRILDHGDGWLPISIPPEVYAAGLSSIRDALAEAGRDVDDFDPAFYLNVVLADTEAEAIDRARDFLERYYPRLNDMTDDEVREHGAFGPPEAVADALERYRDAGVETFVVRFTAAEQAEQVRRFAELMR